MIQKLHPQGAPNKTDLHVLLSFADNGKKVFCYYSSFAQNRQGIGKFLPEDIDPFLCTHIIFAFVDIDPSGNDLMAFNRNDQGHNGEYCDVKHCDVIVCTG